MLDYHKPPTNICVVAQSALVHLEHHQLVGNLPVPEFIAIQRCLLCYLRDDVLPAIIDEVILHLSVNATPGFTGRAHPSLDDASRIIDGI
jgi:hypothetical protein